MAAGPFARIEWMMAGRYLRARKQESFVSIISIFSFLGIALGVATLIIVMSVMNGFRYELLSRILGLNGHLLVQPIAGDLYDYDATTAAIRNIPGVTRAAPIVDGQAMASANEIGTGALVRGMRADDLASLTLVSDTLSPGALEEYANGKSVIIGRRLARQLGLGPDDRITIIGQKGPVTAFGSTPRIKTYRVAGTFNVGMSEYDSAYVFMPLEEAQLFFNHEETVSAIEVMTADADNLDGVAAAVAGVVPRIAQVVAWQDVNASFFTALQVERNVMFLILTLIIVVAALNIISGLIMLVKDKSRNIAILRTMGATRGAILRIFMIAGSSIGVLGTLGGFVLGVVFCENIESIRQFFQWLTGTELFNPELYFLSQLPAEMEAGEVATVVLMSLSISFLATLYPSWRAASLDPVEALRYE